MKRLPVTISSFFVGLLSPVVVFASGDYGLKATAQAARLDRNENLPELIGGVIGTGLSLISVIFFALMIYGGVKWMVSRGNEEQSKKALDTIIAAIIGIIIVLASYAITTFVFNSVGATGAGGGGGTPQTNQTPPLVPAPKVGEACIGEVDASNCAAGLLCTNGICTSPTIIPPPQAGQACIGEEDASNCAAGLLCTNGVCTSP